MRFQIKSILHFQSIKILTPAVRPFLFFSNQSIGPLFDRIILDASKRSAIYVFPGLRYRRTPAAARLLTWAVFSLQLAWHLFWHGRRYSRLLLVSNPPIAPLLAPLARRPYALLLYDLYPQVLSQLQPRHALQRRALVLLVQLWHAANRPVFARAERLFTLSAAMADQLRPCFASEALWQARVQVIPPWADTSQLQPSPAAARAFRHAHGIQGLLLSYSGNLGLTHPLEPLLEAAALLTARPNPAPVQVLLIGDGPKRSRLQQQARALQLRAHHLRFLQRLPYSELAGSLSAADLAIVALDGPAAAASLPSKTFNALACGTPLLALAPTDSALAQLVQRHHCGLVIEPGPAAPRQLAAAITQLLDDPAQLQQLAANALAAAGHYTPANAEQLLEAWLGPLPVAP